MSKFISKYWSYQLFGWGVFCVTNIFFAITFKNLDTIFICGLLVYLGIGLIISHLMRFVIKDLKVLTWQVQRQIIGFIAITFCFAIVASILESLLVKYFHLLRTTETGGKELDISRLILSNFFTSFIFFFMWNSIYYIYHYVEKSRKQQLDTLKLETLVKELELKTIKSHINPHFIFNALNSIRALVDENPVRARSAITELSNILRSSMQAEKLETVPLHRELDIVKDYLALEQMRFEERLRVEMNIDEDTLDQPVPPMMLQTLVENAIKHGISKQVNGGVITIISDFVGDHHELVVRNSGQLATARLNGEGFGIRSTQDRLNLLYQDKASFDIHNLSPDTVESKVIMPLALEGQMFGQVHKYN